MILRQVLLPGSDLIEQVQTQLIDHIGGELSIDPIRQVIDAVMGNYCYGHLPRASLAEMLVGYGVDRYVALDVEQTLSHSLQEMVQRAFVIVYPTRKYTFEWFNSRDLLVCEHELSVEFLTAVDTDSEEDGYVPARLRKR